MRSFTVLENLVVAQHASVRSSGLAALARRAGRDARGAAAARSGPTDVLDFMGLAGFRDRPIGGLPYGTLKMVEVAAVLATDPSILMLDEPLAGASGEEGSAFCDRVRAHAPRARPVDHPDRAPRAAGAAAPRTTSTSSTSARMLAQGTPDEVRDNPEVAEAYMGEGASTLA